VRRPLLFFFLVAACGKTTAVHDRVPLDDAACGIPTHQEGAVIAITRHVVPIGEIRIEAGEITATGRCSPTTECVHVAPPEMDRLLGLVRTMGPIRHRSADVSPHYGYRGIEVRWGPQVLLGMEKPAAEKCTFSDGSVQPIDEHDEKKFYAVYDTIRDAITKSPEHVEPAPTPSP
jgi:hypothetical protein